MISENDSETSNFRFIRLKQYNDVNMTTTKPNDLTKQAGFLLRKTVLLSVARGHHLVSKLMHLKAVFKMWPHSFGLYMVHLIISDIAHLVTTYSTEAATSKN